MKFIRNIIRKYVGIFRADAWRLYSDEYLEKRIEICFIGSEIQKNFIKKAFFPDSGEEQYLGVKYFFRFRQVSPVRRNYDLTIIEKLSENQFPAINSIHWQIPHWVQTYTDIPLVKFNNSFRSDLRLIRKNELDYQVTTEVSKIEMFYESMYLPLVNQRHAESSIPMGLEELLNTIESGKAELLLVYCKNSPISGMVIDYRGLLPNLWSVGVLNCDRELLKIGAIPACYHYCYIHLEEAGYSRVSLGYCRSFIDDGVLKFKRKFGLKILKATDRGFIIIPNHFSPALAKLLQGHAFFHSLGGNLHLVSFIDNQEDCERYQASILSKNANLGLMSSTIYSILDSSIRKISDKEFDQSLTPVLDIISTTTMRDSRSSDATYFLRHLMNIRTEKSMLLYGDELSDIQTLDAIKSAACSMSLDVEYLMLDPAKTLEQQSEQIEELVKARKFDIVCEASAQYFYNTPSWRTANMLGIKTYGLGPLDLESLRDCVGLVDHHKVYFQGERIAQIIRRSSMIYITDKNGTKLVVRSKRPISNKILSKLRLRKAFYCNVHRPTGFLTSSVKSTFLGGQLSFMGYRPGIHGKIVLDGYLWPPKQVGKISKHVTLEIKQGSIVNIEGGKEAETFAMQQPSTERNLEHICIGLNPGAKLGKNLMESERALGACNFGFGEYPFHADGVISQPTIIVDGKILIENGVLVKGI